MNIGDKITITQIIHKERIYSEEVPRQRTEWRPLWPYVPEVKSIDGVYLGRVNVFNGYMDSCWDGYGNIEETFFVQSETIAAIVVQPVDNSGQYRKPVYTLIEYVKED